MLKIRMKRQADEGRRAMARLAAIRGSIAALGDEDLLDLADIFSTGGDTPLKALAAAEMERRGLRL